MRSLLGLIGLMTLIGASDPAATWFQAGSCPSFTGPYTHNPPYGGKPPLVSRALEALVWPASLRTMNLSRPVPSYVYDPKHGIAFKTVGQDSGIERTLRYDSAPPPAGVPTADLSGFHTTSGATLGRSAASIIRMFGKPYIVKGCGIERYAYSTGEQEDALEFTIQNNRVIEIYITVSG